MELEQTRVVGSVAAIDRMPGRCGIDHCVVLLSFPSLLVIRRFGLNIHERWLCLPEVLGLGLGLPRLPGVLGLLQVLRLLEVLGLLVVVGRWLRRR